VYDLKKKKTPSLQELAAHSESLVCSICGKRCTHSLCSYDFCLGNVISDDKKVRNGFPAVSCVVVELQVGVFSFWFGLL
jgi:hypothetical protein